MRILFYSHMILYLSVHSNGNNHTHILYNKNWILVMVTQTHQITIFSLHQVAAIY